MSDPPNALPLRRRLFRLTAQASAMVLIGIALFLIPYLNTWIWQCVRFILPTNLASFLERIRIYLAIGLLTIPLTSRDRRLSLPARFRGYLESSSNLCLSWILPWVLSVGAGLMLVTWIPHYLTWPWWADTEYFAVMAQAWDVGILPYRDLYDFNFPGPIYVHWMLGKLFGWGRTWSFYALDVALLLGLGWSMIVWSRRRLGGSVPGLVGFVTWLSYDLQLDYAVVAQRDAHATLLSVLALILLETRRDRIGLIGSAVAFAAALSIRPHPIVLAPAILSAIDEYARREGEPLRRTVLVGLVWSGLTALVLIASAAPLLIAGVGDDFVRWFQVAWVGGNYNQGGSRDFVGILWEQCERLPTVAVLLALARLSFLRVPESRMARTWFLALLFVLLYKPISPVIHDYLTHPSILVWSVALGMASSRLTMTTRLPSAIRLLFLLAILHESVPGVPLYCRGAAALRAGRELVAGRSPEIAPPGADYPFRNAESRRSISWEDYQSVLAYLRNQVGPQTRVANFLNFYPYPTLNGPSGRLPVFPSPGGFLWLGHAAPEMEQEFAAALERPTDAVVVWRPDGRGAAPHLRLPLIASAIPRHYEFEATIGSVEVWRRKPVRTEALGSLPAGPSKHQPSSPLRSIEDNHGSP